PKKFNANQTANAKVTGPNNSKLAYSKFTGSLLLLKYAMGEENPTTAQKIRAVVNISFHEASHLPCCCATPSCSAVRSARCTNGASKGSCCARTLLLIVCSVQRPLCYSCRRIASANRYRGHKLPSGNVKKHRTCLAFPMNRFTCFR